MIQIDNRTIESELKDRFALWNNIIKNGSNDPYWPDGINLNLVRNQIKYYKEKCEENNFFPEVYFIDTPQKVPNSYSVKIFELDNNNQLTLFKIIK